MYHDKTPDHQNKVKPALELSLVYLVRHGRSDSSSNPAAHDARRARHREQHPLLSITTSGTAVALVRATYAVHLAPRSAPLTIFHNTSFNMDLSFENCLLSFSFMDHVIITYFRYNRDKKLI
jgi:hypothetical protein